MNEVPGQLASALADRYRIERELGQGGMATVYLAEELKHPRRVAVKVLRPELAASVGTERFAQEIAIAARLEHAFIVPLLDSGTQNGIVYYTMPFVEGASLRARLGDGVALPIDEAVGILRDLAEAMAYAHRAGVVHRDLKPENVMLADGHVRVMDFGIAKALTEGQAAGPATAGQTPFGVAIGTPAYMSPEQACAEPVIDHRSDLYAWGVIAYELLTGRPPFERPTMQQLIAAQISEAPVPLSERRAELPVSLALLVMQCLEKSPSARPTSAEEIVGRLGLRQTGEEVGAVDGARSPRPDGVRVAGRGDVGVGARLPRAIALFAVAATLALGVAWSRGNWPFAPPMDPDLVLVLPVELDGPGSSPEVAATLGRIEEALPAAMTREGILRAVDAARVRELVGTQGMLSPDDRERLARRTGAGLMLGTRCAVGAVLCRVELRRMPGSRTRVAALVERDRGDAPLAERVEEQALVLMLLQARYGDRTTWDGYRVTPSLEAVRANIRMDDAFEQEDWEAMGRWAARAESLDARLISPAIVRAQSAASSPQERDSALARLAARPGLTAVERKKVEVVQSSFRGERDRAFPLALDLFRAFPADHLRDVMELGVNRYPHEVLRAAAIGESLFAVPPRWLLGLQTVPLHRLGRHEEGITLAERKRRHYPEVLRNSAITDELVAKAALGDTAGVRAIVDASEGARLQQRNAGTRAQPAAMELLTHGHAAAGRAMMERSLEWYRRMRLERGDWRWVENEMWSLMWTDHLNEAAALARDVQRRGERDAWVCDAPQVLGVVAARQGRRTEALAFDRQLSATAARLARWPATSWAQDSAFALVDNCQFLRAAIHAQLGDREEAVRLLRAAREFRSSHMGEYFLSHRWPDLLVLRGYPPYEELYRVPDPLP